MTNRSQKDKAMFAIVGALIGDALGLGCHWYYDLKQLKSVWIVFKIGSSQTQEIFIPLDRWIQSYVTDFC